MNRAGEPAAIGRARRGRRVLPVRRVARAAQAEAGTNDAPCACRSLVATAAVPGRLQPLLTGDRPGDGGVIAGCPPVGTTADIPPSLVGHGITRRRRRGRLIHVAPPRSEPGGGPLTAGGQDGKDPPSISSTVRNTNGACDARGSGRSTLEDAVAAGADQRGDDQQDDAPEDGAADQHDDSDHGDDRRDDRRGPWMTWVPFFRSLPLMITVTAFGRRPNDGRGRRRSSPSRCAR